MTSIHDLNSGKLEAGSDAFTRYRQAKDMFQRIAVDDVVAVLIPVRVLKLMLPYLYAITLYPLKGGGGINFAKWLDLNIGMVMGVNIFVASDELMDGATREPTEFVFNPNPEMLLLERTRVTDHQMWELYSEVSPYASLTKEQFMAGLEFARVGAPESLP